MPEYDLIIIGGGPAGYRAAELAAANGLKTLLFEKGKPGGTCLHEGCIPTKTFLHGAKVKDYAVNGGEYGLTVQTANLSHAAVLQRKTKVLRRLALGIAAALKAAGAEVVQAEAVIQGKTADGFTVSAAGAVWTSKYLLIATGSEAAFPPVPGLTESYAAGNTLTSREMLEIKEIPASLTVIGGGAVGLEFAAYAAAHGTQVTIVEMFPYIAPGFDTGLSDGLQAALSKKGIRFITEAKVTRIEGSTAVVLKDGAEQRIENEKILFAAGRKPKISGFGAENIGLDISKGKIETDAGMRTKVKNVFAAGDVNGKSMLAHTAYREAEAAVRQMLGQKDEVEYSAIPAVIYTSPEAAWAGESEKSAQEKGLEISVLTLPLAYSGRYAAENKDLDGKIKIIADAKKEYLLGVHILGSYASEIIFGAAAFIALKTPVDQIVKLVFPHPTVSEILKEALLKLQDGLE